MSKYNKDMDINLFDVNLNNLKYFYMIVKLGSFTKASEYFYISQPNISYAVKQLENYFGVKLLIRNRSGIKLTAIGERIYGKIEDLFKNLDDCNLMIKEKADTETLSIGIQSHVYLLFKDRVKKFIKDNEFSKVSFHQDSTQVLIEKLNENKIDFLIDTAPISLTSKNLEMINIKSERLCFVSKKDLNENGKKLKIKDLVNLQLILPSLRSNLRKSLETLFNKHNISLNPAYVCNATDVTIDLVKSGAGVGYVFESAVKEDVLNKKLYMVNVDFELPQIPLCFVRKKDNKSKVVDDFLNMILEEKGV